MKSLLLLLMIRYYWPQELENYAERGSVRPRVQIDGYVIYTRTEKDGDLHIRLCDTLDARGMDRRHCIVCEIIPTLPVPRPPIHAHIRVKGISRFDPEHGWREVHPVEAWSYLP